jgi:hypothetical protein
MSVPVIIWAVFWFWNYIPTNHMSRIAKLLGIVVIFAVIAAIVIFLRKSKIPTNRLAYNTLATVVCLLFFYNFYPGFADYIKSGDGSINPLAYTKKNFNVNKTAQHPNIYWFHMEAMMSFAEVEQQFGDSQKEIKQELVDRNFLINENAVLNAGFTLAAVPSLLCPSFYDNYFVSLAEQMKFLPTIDRRAFFRKRLDDDIGKWTLVEKMFEQLELFTAFRKTGYNLALIADSNQLWFPEDNFYELYDYETPLTIGKIETDHSLYNFKYMISLSTALPLGFFDFIKESENNYEQFAIPSYDDIVAEYTEDTSNFGYDATLYRLLYDALQRTEYPRLIYIQDFLQHGPFYIDETGHRYEPVPDDPAAIPLYLPQHKFSIKEMIKAIDMVLKNDPDAVIVIQADHGTHLKETQEWAQKNGFPLDTFVEMNNSVISAVRIPEKWGGLSEPLDPLNISRLLVNRYVGQNYNLLPPNADLK